MNLAKHAGEFGYEIEVLFFAEGPLREQASAAGIRAAVVPWKGTLKDVWGALRVYRWLRRNPARIAHLHWGGRVVQTICRLAGAQVVVQHVHGRVNETTCEVTESFSFPGADAVVGSSKAVAANVRSHRAEVIYAGIEVDPAPEFLTAHAGPLRVGTLSRLTPVKNIELFIEAVARLREIGVEIQANIAGSGPSETALRDLAERLQISDRICFLGWQEDIRSVLSSWDLLVMTSLDEGFPVSAVEAMAAARPVVATRVGGLEEIVVDGVTGYLIPARDREALVRCIAELAKDRTKLSKMARASWERAQSEFSARMMSLQMARLYDRLSKRQPEDSSSE